MGSPEAALRARARRAYELGRLRHAVAVAWPALPLAAVGLAARPAPGSVPIALLLVAVALGLAWRGRGAGRAVRLGLAAGIAPIVLPLAMMRLGHFCVDGRCLSSCLAGCVLGGGLAGLVVGARAAREPTARADFALGAGAVAVLAGTLGCAWAGVPGVLGMIAGVVVTSAPIAVFGRSARA